MKRSLVAFALAFLVPAAALGGPVAMLPVQCTNLTDSECAAVGAVFSGAYATASGAQVTMAGEGPPAGTPYTPPAGAPAYAPPAASEQLVVSAIRLTSRISLRASLTRPDGAPLHAVEMTASSLDDLPPAADRMSRALVNRVSVAESMNLHNITRSEGTKANRTTTEKVMGVKTGLIVPVASGVDLQPMLSVQFDGRFEADRYFLEFGAGLMLPGDTDDRIGYGGVFAEFGASAYLGQLGSPFYLGGGIMPRILGASGNGNAGIRAAFYGQSGLMFMRTSSTRLYAELRVAQNVIPVKIGGGYVSQPPTANNPYGTSSYQAGSSVYPTEFGLQMGIGW